MLLISGKKIGITDVNLEILNELFTCMTLEKMPLPYMA
jgi:hypothetical protein